MSDMFAAAATETRWEWAKNRRQWFTSQFKDTVIGVLSAIVTAAATYYLGDSEWPVALKSGVFAGLLMGVVPPYIEALRWYVSYDRLHLEEENERLRVENRSIVRPPPKDASEWLSVVVGKPDWDDSMAAVSRKMHAVVTGGVASRRLIVPEVTVTNMTNEAVSVTVRLLGPDRKPRDASVGGPTDASDRLISYPINLEARKGDHGRLAFDVRDGGGITGALIEFIDGQTGRVLTVPAPGRIPVKGSL